MTGLSLGLDYKNDSHACGSEVAEDGQSVKVWGAGDLEQSILIGGFLKLRTRRLSIEHTFQL